MIKNLCYFCCYSFLLMACSSPKNTTKDFLEAMNNSNFETAMSLVSEDSKPILYSLINQQTQDIPSVDVEVKNCTELDDHTMECIYAISDNAGVNFERTLVLIKEDDSWKVDLTHP